jgi:NitT/TauT family transport system substrate-binding protein
MHRGKRPLFDTLSSIARAPIAAAVLAFAALACAPARAGDDLKEVRIAVQYGVAFTPVLIADGKGFIEKRLREAGLSDTKVRLTRLSGAPAVNDALLSGSLEFAVYGTTGFLIIWDKTRGGLNVKALCAISAVSNVLLTNRPDIKSIQDFKPEDRISTPANVSPQAMVVRMAAEKAFGKGQFAKLDSQLVTQSNPDGLQALINRVGVTGLVTTPPFYSFALESPGIHVVTRSEELMGGPATFLVLAATEKLTQANPKITRAVLAAMEDANAFIKANPKEAAEIYIKSENSKMQVDFVTKVITDPTNIFTIEPMRVTQYADLMHRMGALKHKPADWKELFLPLIADRNGS